MQAEQGETVPLYSSSPPSEPPSGPPLKTPSKVVPWLVSLAFFMQMLDSTIVNTALPSMAVSLHANPLRMQSVVIAYILSVALLIPASGWLADRFGSRRIFLLAILLFTLGSIACAFSPNLKVLIVSRVLQGTGGALLVPVGRLIILKAYPREQFVALLSFVSVPALIGPIMGPVLGGFLTQYASWNWIFLINIPVGVAGFIISWHHMPDVRSKNVGKFDWLGFFLFGVSTIFLSLALGALSEMQLPHVQIVGLFVVGAASLSIYWLYAARAVDPLFSPSLFSIRSFAVGIFGNLFSRLGSGAMPYLLPLFFQVALGYSPSHSGLLMMPLPLAALVSKFMLRRVLDFFGYRRFLILNTLAMGVLIATFALLGTTTHVALLFPLLLMLGVVNSMQFTAMNSITLVELADHHAASGNSMLSIIMQLSVSLGIGVGAAFLEGFEGYFGSGGEGQRTAFAATYICLGVISMLAALVFLQLDKKAGRDDNAQPTHVKSA